LEENTSGERGIAMLHVALFCLLVGQVPPPLAIPQPPNSQSPAAAELPSTPQAQREWLLAHLIVDMQAQGKHDAQKYREIESMLNNVSASQLGVLVNYYQQRKAQVEAWQKAQAESNLRRLEAYRDSLKRELVWKIATLQQEQAISCGPFGLRPDAHGRPPPRPRRSAGQVASSYS